MPSPARPLLFAAAAVFGVATLAARLTAQSPAASPPGGPPPAATPFAQLLAPALTQVTAATGAVHPEKWKLSGELHQRTEDNLHSINGDITGNLPALVSAADTPPPNPASTLALSRNLDALYDVLLRVTIAGDLSAPDSQRQSLDAALASLNDARRSVADRLRSSLLAQSQQLTEAQASLAHATASLASADATIQALSQPKPAARTTTKTHPHTHRKPATPASSTPPPQTP